MVLDSIFNVSQALLAYFSFYRSATERQKPRTRFTCKVYLFLAVSEKPGAIALWLNNLEDCV